MWPEAEMLEGLILLPEILSLRLLSLSLPPARTHTQQKFPAATPSTCVRMDTWLTPTGRKAACLTKW